MPADQLVEALRAAKAIDDEKLRAEALGELAAHLPPDQMEEALKTAKAISDDRDRACAPSAAIYVGDSVECDIVPAQALGVRAILIDEPGRAPEGVEAAASLADLRALFCHKGANIDG